MTKGTHPKGICDLRKLLQKGQMRLTQAGSLIIGYLRIIRHKLLMPFAHASEFHLGHSSRLFL